MNLIAYADGTKDLLSLADQLQLPFPLLADIAEELLGQEDIRASLSNVLLAWPGLALYLSVLGSRLLSAPSWSSCGCGVLWQPIFMI